jgi:hypothetical protein
LEEKKRKVEHQTLGAGQKLWYSSDSPERFTLEHYLFFYRSLHTIAGGYGRPAILPLRLGDNVD